MTPPPGLSLLWTIDIQANLDLFLPRHRDVATGGGNNHRLATTREPIRLAQVHPNHQVLALDLHLDILCSHRPPPFPTATLTASHSRPHPHRDPCPLSTLRV